jgi:uncharacterized membrane protein
MKKITPRLIGIFLTGILAVLPLAATVALFVFVLRLTVDSFGPSSLVGSVLTSIGLGVTGSELVGYVIGLAFLLVLIFMLGVLVEKGFQRGLTAALNALVSRIPIVRNVYDTLSRFVALVSKKNDGSGMSSMRPVWCSFGGPGGVSVLGLLSSSEPVMVGDTVCYAVLVPTAPVPVGGGLLYVPVAWVKSADIGMEALTSIYVSMGVTSSQYMPRPEGTTPDKAISTL